LGVEGAHFFGALLQDFFIDKHNLPLFNLCILLFSLIENKYKGNHI